jgi:hypothetical protein
MNEHAHPTDLEPDERALHALLSAVPPQAPPVGFRDGVMRRVTARQRVGWEWLVAALLAFPSFAFLARQLLVNGDEFAAALTNVVLTASSDASNASFFIDGLTILAVALIGIASVLAAHALIATTPGRHRFIR